MKQQTQIQKRDLARQLNIVHLAFSNTSKMPCRSWSNQAGVDCPGSRTRNVITGDMEILPVCKACFAKEGHYRRLSVEHVRKFNSQEWKHPDFTRVMIEALLTDLYFRWFDSGDVSTLLLARKLYLIMLESSQTKFWLPTQSWRIPKFVPILEAMNRLPNCVVRYSSGSVMGDIIPTNAPQSTVYKEVDEIPANAFICQAYSHTPATCSSCRACWDSDISIIAYHGRGQQFNKAYEEEKRRKEETIMKTEAINIVKWHIERWPQHQRKLKELLEKAEEDDFFSLPTLIEVERHYELECNLIIDPPENSTCLIGWADCV